MKQVTAGNTVALVNAPIDMWHLHSFL